MITSAATFEPASVATPAPTIAPPAIIIGTPAIAPIPVPESPVPASISAFPPCFDASPRALPPFSTASPAALPPFSIPLLAVSVAFSANFPTRDSEVSEEELLLPPPPNLSFTPPATVPATATAVPATAPAVLCIYESILEPPELSTLLKPNILTISPTFAIYFNEITPQIIITITEEKYKPLSSERTLNNSS
ncbi:MAG: hypothetical protein BWY74_04538 [Firmicutes bacterium ADurb.Bin419]|nr:MAG: hypothetical protein BWY74_04538 [Firmicutes bacterium ADurb.Bin419]